MKKLLFAIDDTEACGRAAQYILDMFGRDPDCSLTLIHAKPEFMLYGEAILAAYDEIEMQESEKAKILTEKFSSFFTERGVNPYVIIKEGEAVEMVLEEAKDHNLLIIGASANSLLNKLFTSHQDDFITRAPIPVLIVK